MTSLVQLYRRSRTVRLLCYLVLFALWAGIAFVSIDSLSAYSKSGDLAGLLVVMAFAVWAWWYGEHRDRRRSTTAAAEVEVGARPRAGA